jgi:hypothetical protein
MPKTNDNIVINSRMRQPRHLTLTANWETYTICDNFKRKYNLEDLSTDGRIMGKMYCKSARSF